VDYERLMSERGTTPVGPGVTTESAAENPSWNEASPGARPTPELAATAVLLLVDWLTVLTCLALVRWLRSWIGANAMPSLGPVTSLAFFVVHLYGLIPWILCFAAARLYTHRALFWDEARRAVYACTAAALVAIAISFAGADVANLSRLVIGGTWVLTLVAVPVVRQRVERWFTRLNLWNRRVLIVGAGASARQVCAHLRANEELGYEPIVFVDDDPSKIGTKLDGIPVAGPLDATAALIRRTGAHEVVLAVPHLSRERLLELVSTCEGQVHSIRVVPDLFGLASVGVEAEDIDGVLLLRMRWNLASRWNRFLKRAFDVLIAGVAGILLAPVLVAAAIATRLDSPGPILFAQQRLGRGRRPFRCYKFRTMYVGGEGKLDALLNAHPESRAEWERFAKVRGRDPRVTRIGQILRKRSFDELPQLFNVLRGEMSLVGPRPYLPNEIERMGTLAETILKASPGLTGLWQVSGRNNLTFEQRLRLDEYYTRNWSLWTDVMVLCKTVGALRRADGAY
jgi:Undecaprenyl-phosphate galactose phosphotransferase WbaP